MLTSVHSTSPAAFGCQQRQRQIAVRRPRTFGLRHRHHLPDGLEHVGRCAQLESAPHEVCRQIDLTHTRRQRFLHVEDRFFGDAAGLSDARDLVGRLRELGRTDHGCGVRGRAAGEQPIRRAAHRAGQLVDSDRCTRRDQLGDHTREMFDPFVEFEKQWRVEMVGRYLRLR
jgi:hypothetical protein